MAKKLICPNCGTEERSRWEYGVFRHIIGNVTYCASCAWNDIPETRQMTRRQYEYFYRLHRLRFRGHCITDEQKFTTQIVMNEIHRINAYTVPFWLQQWFMSMDMKMLTRWYFQPLTKSRWEYHSMMEHGEISGWAEYKRMYVRRRAAEEEWRVDEDEYYYCDFYDC